MKLIYQLGTFIYFLMVRIASLWNPKAKLFIQGRKKSWELLNGFEAEGKEVYWFHCASLGEFEQARPLIENLKTSRECKIVITFFSPSGYEIRKNYNQADLILYLPQDSFKNANKFLGIVKPTKIFFIKYEFWANYLIEAKKKSIPTYLVSGVFRESQMFFKWYGGFMRNILKSFDTVFVQNENSHTLLNVINVDSIVTGDTRFDRVIQNAAKVESFPIIERFINGSKILVIGSCWAEDELIIFPILNDSTSEKIIIAPHEIDESHLANIEKSIKKKVLRYSLIDSMENIYDYDVLLIDNIGILMHLYQYADVAYIGGAFGKGLHNILEPASFGVPVIFGNKYSKFPEAYQFIDAKIGFSINDSNEFSKVYDKLLSENMSNKVSLFMNSQKGASDKIMSEIF
jgi:3-deoxy-D-manno-octulosonic-acid transferase